MEGSYYGIFETLGLLIFYICFPLIVTFLMVYVANYYGGFYAWVVCAALMTPFIGYWYVTIANRVRNYLNALFSEKPLEWSVEKSVNEFKELLEKQRRKKQKE